MVTKQRQLEWLAKHFDFDLQRINYVITSSTETGLIIGSGTSTAPESSAISTRRHIITRQEWQRERDKMSSKPEVDNSWHERGELPPVGCECVWADESGVFGAAGVGYPDIGDVVSICAHKQTPGGDVIAIFTWAPGGNGLCVAASRMPEDFRPLRTERENAIDEMANLIAKSVFGSAKCQAEKLYDAGYRKVNP